MGYILKYPAVMALYDIVHSLRFALFLKVNFICQSCGAEVRHSSIKTEW